MQHVTKGDAQAPLHDATLTALTLNPRRSKIEDVPEQDHEYDPGITVKDSTNLVAVEHLGSLLHLWQLSLQCLHLDDCELAACNVIGCRV